MITKIATGGSELNLSVESLEILTRLVTPKNWHGTGNSKYRHQDTLTKKGKKGTGAGQAHVEKMKGLSPE